MNEIDEIKARLDIVDVIGSYVHLEKAGRTFKSTCPFHSERTPSFIVSPDRQSWHCFGACGTGGDVISFVMRKEGLEFPEALRMLAVRAGVRLSEKSISHKQDAELQRLYAANEAAAAYYRELLINSRGGEAARSYLERRRVGKQVADAFSLGYAGQEWEGLLSRLRGLGFTDAEMIAAGLVLEGERGLHDRFRGRLTFPIRDTRGRVLGFGARALDESLPKYINTSQTRVFDKSAILYAMDRAREGIRREGLAVVVEGYMDAIAAHENGFDTVVAQMGTALTSRQVQALKRLTSVIVLALDADSAGNQAVLRGHEVVREAGQDGSQTVPVLGWRGLVGYQQTIDVDLRVASLPDGRDPDDLIRADANAWRRLIDSARPVLDYRLEAAAASRDLSEPRGRSQLVQEFLPLLSAVTDPVVRAHYLQRLSRVSLTPEDQLAGALQGLRVRPAGREAQPVVPVLAASRSDPREDFLLALLLRHSELRGLADDLPEELLWSAENRKVLAALKQDHESEGVSIHVPEEMAGHLERLSEHKMPSFEPSEARQALTDCRLRLERRNLEAEKQAISALLADREEEVGIGGAEAETNDRTKELLDLQLRDMETGLKLHGRETNSGSGAVETRTNG